MILYSYTSYFLHVSDNRFFIHRTYFNIFLVTFHDSTRILIEIHAAYYLVLVE